MGTLQDICAAIVAVGLLTFLVRNARRTFLAFLNSREKKRQPPLDEDDKTPPPRAA
jgi:hypothetical protein